MRGLKGGQFGGCGGTLVAGLEEAGVGLECFLGGAM